MRRMTLCAALALTACVVLAGCGQSGTTAGSGPGTGSQISGPAAPAGAVDMTVGYTAIGAAYDDLYICQDKGVFAKNGLNVTLTTLNTSSSLLAALASNTVQIGIGVAQSTAAGALKGIDVRYIAMPIGAYYVEMWGKTDINSTDDLKGKKVGVSSPGSLSDAAMGALLADKGLTGQVEVVYLKSIPAEVAALQAGAVDAIVTQPPNGAQTGAQGFHKILDFTNYKAAANAYTTTKDYIDSNKDAVAAFVKSEVECLAMLHNDKASAVASIQAHSGNDDAALADYSYEFFDKLWAKTPTTDPDLLKAAFVAAASDAKVDPPADVTQFIDDSFLQSLTASGFVDSLYQK